MNDWLELISEAKIAEWQSLYKSNKELYREMMNFTIQFRDGSRATISELMSNYDDGYRASAKSRCCS